MKGEVLYQIGDSVIVDGVKGTVVFKEPNPKSKKLWGLDNIKSLESIGLWVYLVRFENGNYSHVCRYYEIELDNIKNNG